MTIDKSGNLYVVGYVPASPAGSRVDFVVKYDSDGQEIWGIQFAGSTSDVATDGAGHLYVVGDVPATPAESRLGLVVKYDSDGNELWRRKLASHIAQKIAADGAGNMYVAGFFSLTSTDGSRVGLKSLAGLVVKYDSEGTELWERRLRGFRGIRGQGSQMMIDNAGNVILVFARAVHATTNDIFQNNYLKSLPPVVWKHDGDGNELPGAKRLGSSVWTTDAAGNVYLAEGSDVARLDSEGKEVWSRKLVTPPRNVKTDLAGNVYFVGGREFVKFDSDGNELWRTWLAYYAGHITAGHITTDTVGNVYVVDGVPDKRFVIVKYDVNGNELWRRPFRTPAGTPTP